MKNVVLVVLSFFSMQAVAQQPFVQGSYYDLQGKKTAGFITLPETKNFSFLFVRFADPSNRYILFKKDSTDLAVRVSGSTLSSFTMNADSFAVLRNFKIFGYRATHNISIGFCRVMVDTGHVQLYSNLYNDMSVTNGPSGRLPVRRTSNIVQSYLLRPNGSNIVTPVPMGIDEFIDQMSRYFYTSDEIVRRIKSREYSFNSTEKLVRDYNEWYASRHP
jgi:hypothetical protein